MDNRFNFTGEPVGQVRKGYEAAVNPKKKSRGAGDQNPLSAVYSPGEHKEQAKYRFKLKGELYCLSELYSPNDLKRLGIEKPVYSVWRYVETLAEKWQFITTVETKAQAIAYVKLLLGM